VSERVADAVVIGSGPNGLVAANALSDAGWDVVILEAADHTGGAVHSAEVTAPGFVSDMFSAFYPLAVASPVIKGLDLGSHGLQWCHSADVLAHALDDGRVAVLRGSISDTAAGLEEFAPGDGAAWIEMFTQWQRIRDPLLDALFTPFPPLRATAKLLGRLGTSGAVDFARLGIIPVRRLAQERFNGDGAALLLTGNAMHSDLPPDAAGSGMFGWLLAMLGQEVGFPVPRHGAGQLAAALTHRARSRGAQVRTGAEVVSVRVRAGRAVGVVLADGSSVGARKAVLADVTAPALYRQLLDPADVPPKLLRDLGRFQWDHGTVKVNWALSQPIPWTAPGARHAGTVHLGVDVDGFVDFSADLSTGRVPTSPFILVGQMTTADATRSPAGTESVWAYTHVPRDMEWSPARVDEHVRRIEEAIERVAPGFTSLQVARHVQSPAILEATNPNLAGGSINGGTSGLHQQLFMRPTPGLGRPETPIAGLFLASASAHPGGGVHGACGWNAAHAALSASGRTGAARRALLRTAWARLLIES
jgi:phytoene dehydrogenase-like protein